MKKETIRFTVSLPNCLFNKMEQEVEKKSYHSRSEYIRDLFRERLIEELWDSSQEEVVGVLTVVFDHHQRGLSEKMVAIQHHHLVNILCCTHVHIDHHQCLETIILRGLAPEVNKLVNQISVLKGVRNANLSRTGMID